MDEQQFWTGLLIVVFLAVVALNMLDRERRSHLTDAQRREEDEDARRFRGEW